MGNRSWILPVKNTGDLAIVKKWMCRERHNSGLNFDYMVSSELNEAGQKTKTPNFFLCASTDGSSGIDSVFRLGYRHEPHLLGEQEISEKTLDFESGWQAAQYSHFVSMDAEDYYSRDNQPDRLMPKGIAVDSLEEYKALHKACVTITEMPESGKAFLEPRRIAWLGEPGSKELTAPVVFMYGMTDESVELVSATLGRPVRALRWNAVMEAYQEERRVMSPAWLSLEYWFNGERGEGRVPVFSGAGRPTVSA